VHRDAAQDRAAYLNEMSKAPTRPQSPDWTHSFIAYRDTNGDTNEFLGMDALADQIGNALALPSGDLLGNAKWVDLAKKYLDLKLYKPEKDSDATHVKRSKRRLYLLLVAEARKRPYATIQF
jgi:hypothetical protein